MPRDEDITTELPAVNFDIVGPAVLALRHAVRTDTGLVREHNEDDFLVLPERKIYLVADGMGGHKAGAVASQICIDTVDAYFKALSEAQGAADTAEHADEDMSDSQDSAQELDETAPHGTIKNADIHLSSALLAANQAIFEASAANSALQGMGTTAVGFRLQEHRLTVCHAGDSRAYMFRNGDLRQLTVDHSLSNFLREIGRDGEARLAEATMSNVIMRALGLEPTVEIERSLVTVEPGDRLLLCSDGLSDLVSDDRISAVLMNPRFKRWQAVEQLVEYALDEGGRDNITVMLVDVYEEGLAPKDDDPAHRDGTDVRPDHMQ